MKIPDTSEIYIAYSTYVYLLLKYNFYLALMKTILLMEFQD